MENYGFPLASIIIVNYNGEKYLYDLFGSLSNQTFKNFEVIFVDNASIDNSLAIAEEFRVKGPFSMKIIRNRRNLGFCEGNNVGIGISDGRYVVFLNNDTYVESTWLEELVKRAELDDKPAVVASVIVNPKNCLSTCGVFYDMYGASWAEEKMNSGTINEDFFYGCGAALLVRKDVLDRVAAFDSALFMYQEDVDLCWRIRLAGYKISYATNAICYHLKSAVNSIKTNLEMPVWKFYHAHAKNRIRILIKNYSFRNLLKLLPITTALIALRASILMMINKKPQYITSVLGGFLWNISNIRDTINHRCLVQRLRRVTDKEVQKFMLNYSIELVGFKNYSIS